MDFNEQEKIFDFIIPIKSIADDSIYTFNGNTVPRVTDILGLVDMGGLLGWANYIGRVKKQTYDSVMKVAADTGTLTHNSIEKFLLNKLEDDSKLPIAFKSFLLWWNNLTSSNDVKVLYTEYRLVCKWFGGTFDLLIKINDKIYLVDYKTSNHVGYKYFMQLAAYRYMLFINKGINIDGVIVLQLHKEIPSYNEFLLDFSNKDHYDFIEYCTTTFFSVVVSYYNIACIKSNFDGIMRKDDY